MSVQASTSLYGLDESLSRSDQELFSIFLRYPDTLLEDGRVDNRGSVIDPIQENDNFTTLSRPGQGQDSDSTTLVGEHHESFPHIASGRSGPSDIYIQALYGERAELKTLLETSTLPEECLHYYALLGETIMSLGTGLFSIARPGRASDLAQVSAWLLDKVLYSCRQADLQVQTIAALKASAAFTSKPKPCQIWSTYSQRARMIARILALPSKQELTIIQSLVFLYKNSVYNGLLHGLANGTKAEQILNDIYDTFMSWLFSYKWWCRGMQELKVKYLQVLTDEFGKHTDAQDEYRDFQYQLRKLRTALANPLSDTAEMAEKVVKKLNLSARRPGPQSHPQRVRIRYKRECTV